MDRKKEHQGVSEDGDAALIREILSGNRNAFGEIVNKYRMQSVRIAAAIVGDMDIARDLTQDAFVKAYKAMGRFDGNARFLPWFIQILRNVCRDYLRRKKRFLFLKERLRREARRNTDALEQFRRNETAMKVREAVSRLSRTSREIIELKHFSGLKYAEIAEVLNIPEGTVMSRLYYARKELRRLLEETMDFSISEDTRDV